MQLFQQFVANIVSNYRFLPNFRSCAINACAVTGEYFSLAVDVIDRSGQLYSIKYTLSLIENVWGVVTAIMPHRIFGGAPLVLFVITAVKTSGIGIVNTLKVLSCGGSERSVLICSNP